MSTADGLVVSSSQIVANDIYRRTIVPIMSPDLNEEELDKSAQRYQEYQQWVSCFFAWPSLGING